MIKLHSWIAFDNGNYSGKGILTDALSCTVTEEINGAYELVMKYPIFGNHGSSIAERDVIEAKPHPGSQTQPFRIYRITRPLNGVITVYARHISYDLNDVPVLPFTALTPGGAVSSLKTNMAYDTPFSLSAPADQLREAEYVLDVPTNARAVLMGESGSIASTYFTEDAGQLYFDWYNVQVQNRRGADRGAKIEYGVNMTKYVRETNRSEFYNGILPYVKNSDGTLYMLNDKIMMESSTWAYKNIAIVDLTSAMKGVTLNQTTLELAADQYMRENNFGKISVSLDVSFVDLKNTAEYAHVQNLQGVSLGDTVTVEFPLYGENTQEMCTKTVYNVLTDQYDSVSIGKLRKGIA